MAGTFVISLDFELLWGVRDHRSAADYGDAILGGREAIPEMLKLFTQYRIRATWATVGLLFARRKKEMLDYAPELQPDYADQNLAAYPAIHREVGEDEDRDPLHFGRSLIERIAETEGQEIGTHTYSHYYTLEPGQTQDAFRADINAAVAIARDASIELKSIVFPRNQFNETHIGICNQLGVQIYRGNASGSAYRPRPGAGQSLAIRAVRLIDAVLPVQGDQTHELENRKDPPFNVPASRFLRPPSSAGLSAHISQVRR